MQRSRYYERIDGSGLADEDNDADLAGEEGVDVGSSSRDVCWRCGQPGHISKECTARGINPLAMIRCFLCGNLGHVAMRCPKASKVRTAYNAIRKRNFNTNESSTEGAICVACNEVGHLNCKWTQPISSSSSSSSSSSAATNAKAQLCCVLCGKHGHLHYNCRAQARSYEEEEESYDDDDDDDDDYDRGHKKKKRKSTKQEEKRGRDRERSPRRHHHRHHSDSAVGSSRHHRR